MADHLLSALHALYHHEDNRVKDEADRWLEQWQQTVEAWSISDAVLHDTNSILEAQYFCAQTLRTKVQRDFDELPDHAIDGLRDSLLTLLIKYSKGAPPVRTQLCLALAAMSVHVPAHRWGSGGVITWLANKLNSVPADTALPCLLELLTVLPQEANSTKIAVRPERRRQHAQELKLSLGQAFEVLSSCLSQPGSRIREQVLEAFGSWLRLSGGTGLPLDGAALSQHPLVTAALEGLKSSEMFHAAVDAVCELVWVTVDPESGALQPSMMPLIQVVVPAVMGLRPRFSVASRRLQAEHDGKEQDTSDEFDDDEDTAKGMARLFAEVGEAYIMLVASAVPETRLPVEAMLEVAGYPDFTICSISFNFWSKLARQLRPTAFSPSRSSSMMVPVQDMASNIESAPAGEDLPMDVSQAELSRRREFFQPAFEKLITLIRGRVRYPEAWGSWSKEAHHEFKRQRHDIADTLDDAAGVVGFGRCLQLLLEPLHQLSAAVSAGAPFDWRSAEAALFCVRSVSRHATEPGDASMLAVLRALPDLPAREGQLQQTVCYVVGQYSNWLSNTIRSGLADVQLLQRLLQALVQALEVPASTPAAAHALSDLSARCGEHLGSCMDALLELYNSSLQAGVGLQLGLQAPQQLRVLVEEDVQQIMEAVCVAACKCLPPDRLPTAAASFLQPVLTLLLQAVSQLPEAGVVAPATSLDPSQGALPPAPPQLSRQFPFLAPLVDRLTTVIQNMNNQEIVADMLGRSWPTLQVVIQRCRSDNTIMEHACRALRYGIKGSGKRCAALVGTLLEVLPALFRQTHHSAFLYIVSELVKTFGDEPAHDAAMGQIVQGLLAEACSGLTRLPDLEQNPELVDDTFLLAKRVLSYCPRILLIAGPALQALLDSALLGVLVQHREACTSVLAFITQLLEPRTLQRSGPDAPSVLQAAFLPRAAMLMRLLLAGIVGMLPTSRLPDVAAALAAVLLALGQQGLSLMAEQLALLPDSTVAQNDKSQLLGAAAATSQGNGVRGLEAAVDEFGDLCRRTKRVRQAAQAALIPAELAQQVMA